MKKLILTIIFVLILCNVAYANSIVPIMTSNNTPSGLVTCDSTLTGYDGWKAFDNVVGGYDLWSSALSPFPHWLQYEFVDSQVINRYYIINRDDPNYSPMAFKLQGYDDTTLQYIDLDSRSNEINWGNKEKRVYSFNNVNSYKKYRLYITQNTGGPTYAQVTELGLEFIPVNVTSVNLSTNSLNLVQGNTSNLVATILPSNASNKTVIWTTSNANIATVDSSGNVTAVSVGSAKIKATTRTTSKSNRTTKYQSIPMHSQHSSLFYVNLKQYTSHHLTVAS